jgi:hypothetical protein
MSTIGFSYEICIKLYPFEAFWTRITKVSSWRVYQIISLQFFGCISPNYFLYYMQSIPLESPHFCTFNELLCIELWWVSAEASPSARPSRRILATARVLAGSLTGTRHAGRVLAPAPALPEPCPGNCQIPGA